MLIVWFFAYKKLAQFAVRCALPPRRSESPVCATDNKPSCVLHLLGWFIGSRGFSSLERRPEFWVLHMILHSWDFPGKSSGVGCHFLLQRLFPTQGSNLGLPHCRQTALPSEPPGKAPDKRSANNIKIKNLKHTVNVARCYSLINYVPVAIQ